MMEIDIELYKIFYTVARLGNITRAAESLYISQPAVTMDIKKLEDLLETTLFIRTKRGVILTNEGKVLYEHVSNAMENLKLGENRLASLKDLETGNIRIGIGTTLTKYFLIDHLEKFHDKYPKVSINIDTSMTSEILNKLENGKIDIAIITNDNLNFKNFNIEYSQDIQYSFICNSDFIELTKNNIPIEKLVNYPILLQQPNSNSRRILDKFLNENNIKINSDIELSSYALIIEFARIGMGIGFVAKDFVKKELENKELFTINTIPSLPKHKIVVLTKKNYMPSYCTQKLIEIISSN
ncbi:MAG: LysR family transcriptional regulator [Clostridiales bacterium]|nr:LysR family transcriptional regulator [Clostridiales bacterium]